MFKESQLLMGTVEFTELNCDGFMSRILQNLENLKILKIINIFKLEVFLLNPAKIISISEFKAFQMHR